MKRKSSITKCELCKAAAAVFCPSDAAFLCWSCDAAVHEANFLVARHLRRTVCSNCKTFTGEFISGVGFHPSTAACPSCTPEDLECLSSTSSACISSTTSPPQECSGCRRSDSSSTATSVKRRRKSSQIMVNNRKVEGIFVNWCGKLGIIEADSDSIVGESVGALKVCMEKWTSLPFRVSLAASMWLGLRLTLEKPALSLKVLKRLEEISGVPAKIIVAVESKLRRAVRGELENRSRLGLEEGWAES